MARTREEFKRPCDKDRKEDNCLEDFVAKHKVNPVTKARIVIAKNTSYAYEKSEESYSLLIPISVNDEFLPLLDDEKDLWVDDESMGKTAPNKARCYMYVLAMVDPATNLTEYRLCINRIENLTRSGNRRIFLFDSSKCGKPLFEKDISCVRFLADYFDAELNSALYATEDNSRAVLVPVSTKYDNGNRKYVKKCGYVELRHQRAVVDQKTYSYVQMLCCKTVNGERKPATISSVLQGEFQLISRYLRFIEDYYNIVNHETFAIQKQLMENSRKDVFKAIVKITKLKKQKQKKRNLECSRNLSRFEVPKRENMTSMYPTTDTNSSIDDCENDEEMRVNEDSDCLTDREYDLCV